MEPIIRKQMYFARIVVRDDEREFYVKERIVKQTTWKIPKEDIEYYPPAGLGVYREQDGQIGILTDDGVVTASAENGLSEAPFAVDDWSYAFYFPGISEPCGLPALFCGWCRGIRIERNIQDIYQVLGKERERRIAIKSIVEY